jgi:hypothetical protein
MTARGIRNNNPLNIRHNADLFQGEVRPATDASFKQFTTAAHGYRAAFVTLGTYLSRGLNTIEKIINAWAPECENNTGAYIGMVVKHSGVPRDRVLTAASGGDYIKIVAAMSRVENSVPAVMADVEKGFEMQDKLKNSEQ